MVLTQGKGYAVITPIGPGHEKLALDAKESIKAAVDYHKGPFNNIEWISMDDTASLMGRRKARNMALDYAMNKKFEWIFFLDADDLLVQNTFELFDKYGEGYDAIWGQIFEMQFDKSNGPRKREGQIEEICSLNDLIFTDPYLTIQIGHFVRTELVKQIGFDERLDVGEDFKYYIQLWQIAKCIKI